jgi:hypothetical protein
MREPREKVSDIDGARKPMESELLTIRLRNWAPIRRRECVRILQGVYIVRIGLDDILAPGRAAAGCSVHRGFVL